MGELHLEIVVDRLRREFGVNAASATPGRLPRDRHAPRRGREQVRPSRLGPARRVRPRPPRRRADGPRRRLRLREPRPDRDIPQEHAPAVEAGVDRGGRAWRPRRPPDDRPPRPGRRRQLSPCDSNNYAFKVAGSKAFVAAANKASPTLLEPVMSLEVVTPDESVGDVLGDLHARRGKVAGITARPGVQTVACFVPMASCSATRPTSGLEPEAEPPHSMEFDHYAEVPQQIRDDLMSRARA